MTRLEKSFRLAAQIAAKHADACKEREAGCLEKQVESTNEVAAVRKQLDTSASNLKSKLDELEAKTKTIEDLSITIKQCQAKK